jgi:chitinase
MDGLDISLFSDFTAVKSQNSGLKTIVALGGWTFNDNDTVTQPVYSDIVSTAANRATFIGNLLAFLRQYAFDGVDFDCGRNPFPIPESLIIFLLRQRPNLPKQSLSGNYWLTRYLGEYPGAPDRGGNPDDGVNFTEFLKELRAAIDQEPVQYVVSFTAPTSYWYLRWFDLSAVQYVDWVNVMAYDLHGTWDATDPIGNQILAHTNLTEINEAFDLFWRNNVPANKLNLGLGFYGRSFQLSDPTCYTPGCLFKGGGAPGPVSSLLEGYVY